LHHGKESKKKQPRKEKRSQKIGKESSQEKGLRKAAKKAKKAVKKAAKKPVAKKKSRRLKRNLQPKISSYASADLRQLQHLLQLQPLHLRPQATVQQEGCRKNNYQTESDDSIAFLFTLVG